MYSQSNLSKCCWSSRLGQKLWSLSETSARQQHLLKKVCWRKEACSCLLHPLLGWSPEVWPVQKRMCHSLPGCGADSGAASMGTHSNREHKLSCWTAAPPAQFLTLHALGGRDGEQQTPWWAAHAAALSLQMRLAAADVLKYEIKDSSKFGWC